jgi:hypothetical protein
MTVSDGRIPSDILVWARLEAFEALNEVDDIVSDGWWAGATAAATAAASHTALDI